MSEYTQKERLIRVLNGEKVDRMPAICVTQTGTVDQMKAVNIFWPEANYDAVQLAGLAEAGHTVVGFEAVRVPFDITAEAEFFGCGIKDGTDVQQPSVISHVVNSLDDLKQFEGYDVTDTSKRISIVLEAIKILADKYGEEVPIIGSMIGPFSLAQHITGDSWFMDIMTKEEYGLEIMEFATEFSIKYALAQVDSGASVFSIIDPTASYQLIGADFYAKFVVPFHQKLIDALKERGVPAVLHICGDTTEGLALMETCGVAAISVDQNVNAATAVSKVEKALIVGNLDPVNCLWNTDVANVKAESERVLKELDGKGLLAPGCGIVSQTPTENLQAMIEVAKTWTY
ncbi:MtaA/CmuA family methyltransferase [Methanococcoides orientis]|uniref:methylcobamide:CoM methyltransferase MtbA n=1 Tax=Methanococcoides orientis TaxID=2822137 RepID=UPI001E29F937|nr:methylcobamide:CoM methyltransferase MtbA [Methanococcoides orientis]UGV40662.1 MtaA/CmuA family methyltransferase [Methanococcoides orientis]